jgi:DNA-binding phage protein
MEISIEYIKAQLQRRVAERQLSKVANGSGVALRTLRRILDDDSANATLHTLDTLTKYLKRTERDKKLEQEDPGAGHEDL